MAVKGANSTSHSSLTGIRDKRNETLERLSSGTRIGKANTLKSTKKALTRTSSSSSAAKKTNKGASTAKQQEKTNGVAADRHHRNIESAVGISSHTTQETLKADESGRRSSNEGPELRSVGGEVTYDVVYEYPDGRREVLSAEDAEDLRRSGALLAGEQVLQEQIRLGEETMYNTRDLVQVDCKGEGFERMSSQEVELMQQHALKSQREAYEQAVKFHMLYQQDTGMIPTQQTLAFDARYDAMEQQQYQPMLYPVMPSLSPQHQAYSEMLPDYSQFDPTTQNTTAQLYQRMPNQPRGPSEMSFTQQQIGTSNPQQCFSGLPRYDQRQVVTGVKTASLSSPNPTAAKEHRAGVTDPVYLQASPNQISQQRSGDHVKKTLPTDVRQQKMHAAHFQLGQSQMYSAAENSPNRSTTQASYIGQQQSAQQQHQQQSPPMLSPMGEAIASASASALVQAGVTSWEDMRFPTAPQPSDVYAVEKYKADVARFFELQRAILDEKAYVSQLPHNMQAHFMVRRKALATSGLAEQEARYRQQLAAAPTHMENVACQNMNGNDKQQHQTVALPAAQGFLKGILNKFYGSDDRNCRQVVLGCLQNIKK